MNEWMNECFYDTQTVKCIEQKIPKNRHHFWQNLQTGQETKTEKP